MTKRELTHKQQLFVDHYLQCWNATEAAVLAGYSEKSARQTGSENLSKPAVRQRIESRLSSFSDNLEVTEIIDSFKKPRRRKAKSGITYILSADNGLFKIGKASNFDNRLKSLNTMLPYDLGVVALFFSEDRHNFENLLHSMFSQFRIKGEWFQLPFRKIKKLIVDFEQYVVEANI